MIDREFLSFAAHVCQELLVDVGYPVNSCIAASGLTCNVLREFGIECEPVSVQVLVANAAYTQWGERHGRWPTIDDRAAGLVGDDCWAISIDRETPTKGMWGGHLVVRTKDWIIDPSVMQFHRPELGLNMDDCSRVFGIGGARRAHSFMGRDGITMTYWFHPGDKSWQETTDAEVYRRGRDLPAVHQVVRELRRYFPHINTKETANDDGDDQRTARQAQGADGAKGTPVRRAGKATRKTR